MAKIYGLVRKGKYEIYNFISLWCSGQDVKRLRVDMREGVSQSETYCIS